MTKSTLLQFYSIVKIVRAKDLPQLSKTYKDSQERLLVMFRKRPETPNDQIPTGFKKGNDEVFTQVINDKIPTGFKKWNQEVFMQVLDELKTIKSDVATIKTRLDNHEKLFRSHGGMK